MTRHGFYTVGLVILTLAILANTYIALHVKGRQAQDEQTTCLIQNRGLEGQGHLTAIMRDIAVLLTPLPGIHSPPTPAPLVRPLADLREQLGVYLTIEGEQPAGRSC